MISQKNAFVGLADPPNINAVSLYHWVAQAFCSSEENAGVACC
jgi:hypothetical protein